MFKYRQILLFNFSSLNKNFEYNFIHNNNLTFVDNKRLAYLNIKKFINLRGLSCQRFQWANIIKIPSITDIQLILGLLFCASLVQHAFAQSIDEVIGTARQQSRVLDVPATVQTFTSEEIENASISTTRFIMMTPGLSQVQPRSWRHAGSSSGNKFRS